MIAIPAGVRVWLATGHTDMRKGFPGLSLQVQEVLKHDPLGGHLFCFRGRRGHLLKVIWHDGQGACLFVKKLERGRFLWPSPADGVVSITPAQMGYLLEGIDWRNPQRTWRPTAVGRSDDPPGNASRFGVARGSGCDSILSMTSAADLPSSLADAHAMILAERVARMEAEANADHAAAEATRAQAKASGIEALIAHLKLTIEKLRRELYGTRSERTARLLDQLELQLEDAEASASEDEISAGEAAAKTTTVASFERRRAGHRKPFPEHLPRERVVVPAPTACKCCGSDRLRKLGEDVTETLEAIPRRWKVIQTVREKFTCRDCEGITQPHAPFHTTPRGFLGPNLLATVMFEKFGQHRPLNRQSERYAREGIDLSVSTLADQVGVRTKVLQPLHELIERHVLAAERLHGDDTTVPILARGKTVTGRIWTYVRDDRPFGGPAPPAVLYHASRDRTAGHAERHLKSWAGIPQADAYSGYNGLYDPSRSPGPITPALCRAHSRRQFFELADIAKNVRRAKSAAAISPIALEAVKRIDALFAIERAINGRDAAERLRVRREQSAPLVADLEAWLREERQRLSRVASVTPPIDYMLRRWERFTGFLDDGRICLTNNAAERSLGGFALGRKAWLFAGSERGADRAAAMATLINTAKLNDIDPQAWLADVLARIAGHPARRLHELLPWEWKSPAVQLPDAA